MNSKPPVRTVAIVGRPNVGKSSIFNRLAGRRIAIVHAERGVTRDRLVAEAAWEGERFVLVDTGGLTALPSGASDRLETLVRRQVQQAAQDAAAFIFVTDIETGALPQDDEVADFLRQTGKPVFIAANKADHPGRDNAAADFAKYAFPVFPVSAEHNRGFDILVPAVLTVLPSASCANQPEALHVSIVGRPNVGKSSFINRLLCNERVIVSDQPGTTRDSIDIPFVIGRAGQARHYLLTDTAGIRHAGKVRSAVEHFSLNRTTRSIALADVVALVLDAAQGPTAQDKAIVRLILDYHKGCVLLVNKWDLLKPCSERTYREALFQAVPFLRFAPVVFLSSKTGFNMRQAVDAVDRVAAQISASLPTGALNRALAQAVQRLQPPLVKGKRLKLYYATQIEKKPITILLFVNDSSKLLPAYRNYLVHALRKAFGLEGAPVIFQLKSHSAREQTGRDAVVD